MQSKSNNKNFRYVSYEEKKASARLAFTPPISKDLDSELDKDVEVLESASVMKVIDLISEGPIEGFSDKDGNTLRFFKPNRKENFPFLQSVFLDEVKVFNPDSGAYNFKIFDLDYREGLEVQDPLPDTYEFAAQTTQKNVRLIPANFMGDGGPKEAVTVSVRGKGTLPKELLTSNEGQWHKYTIKNKSVIHKIFKNQEKNLFQVSHTIVNPLVEIVNINITVHVLSKLKTGKRSSKQVPTELSFLIYVGNETGVVDLENPPLYEVNEPVPRDLGYKKGELVFNDTGGYFVKVIKGIATSDYVFENIIHLPPNPNNVNRIVKVFRLEPDLGYQSSSSQVEASLHSITEIIPHRLSYPNCALIGTTLDARSFQQIPTRKFDLKLLKVKVPANYLPDTKEYVGNWNGRFKTLTNRIDPKQEFDTIIRGKTSPENYTTITAEGGDNSARVKINTSTKKYGSGSIFFDSSNGLGITADYAKRISIKRPENFVPLNKDGGPNINMRIGDFGFSDFTIEFYIKVSAAQVKTIYTTSGSSHTTSGVEGIYKTIISSGEGNPPATGFNRSDGELGVVHPQEFETKRKVGHSSEDDFSLPLAGNWFVQVGTANGKEEGQIIFRYFVAQGYWEAENMGNGWGIGVAKSHEKINLTGNDQVEEKVSIKSTTNIADDAFHHVAITRQGSTFKIFVDGVDVTSGPKQTYPGDVRGFVFRSETQAEKESGNVKGTGLVNIGNDRSITYVNASTAVHTSFNGFLDHIHVIRKCKYDSNFNSVTHAGGGTGSNPTIVTDLIDNEVETVFLLTGDGQPNNSTFIQDHNPSIITGAELFDYNENEDNAHLQWTDNPAWIFYDIITNKRYGLGKYGVSSDFVNKWNLFELAKHCDELVPTGFSPKHGHREFEVIEGGNAFTVVAGGEFIKINGFQNQDEFTEEFPDNATIALYNLDDKAQPVHRRIRYLTDDSGSTKDAEALTEDKLLSYKASTKTAGSAVIALQRVVSAEEAFLLNPVLQSNLITKSLNKEGTSNLKTSNQLVLDYIYNKETAETDAVKQEFDVNKKINDTSTSGFCSAEFKKEFDVLEPRFTCNLYLTTAVDAFKVLNDLASVFRGLTYIVGGKVFASFDKKRLPVMNFTNANIKDGSFRYTGSPKTNRFTTALVRYVDKYENFRPKVEYVEDPEGIIKYGLIEKELVAFGCISRGQARRLGQWFLFSSQIETESVKFSAGKEASYLRPGDVVKIIDKNKVNKRYGGRVTKIDGITKKITLDYDIQEDVIGQKITIALPKPFETEESLDQSVSEKEGVTDDRLSQQRAPQLKEFRISAIEKDTSVPPKNNILTLENIGGDPATDIGKIKVGAIWILQNSDKALKIKEVLYRVMNVEEVSPVEYDILCLEYNESKFDAVENDLKLDKVRYKGVSSDSNKPNEVTDFNLSVISSNSADEKQSDKTIIISLNQETLDSLEDTDNLIVTLSLQSNVNGRLVKYNKTITQRAFPVDYHKMTTEKLTTITFNLKDFQGKILSTKVVIDRGGVISSSLLVAGDGEDGEDDD